MDSFEGEEEGLGLFVSFCGRIRDEFNWCMGLSWRGRKWERNVVSVETKVALVADFYDFVLHIDNLEFPLFILVSVPISVPAIERELSLH